MASDERHSPYTAEQLRMERYSVAGSMSGTPRGPICGAIYSDWADTGRGLKPRICWQVPGHSALHDGPEISADRITEAAYCNQQDSG